MRGCVRSCSRRQRRPQHHPEPSARPAFACPAAAAAGAVPATVSPKLSLHGQVNLCGRLLLLFLLLFQLLLLPLPSRSRKPLTQLTLARLQTVSSAQLFSRSSGSPKALDPSPRLLFFCKVASLYIFSPPPPPCLSSVQPPRSLLLELRPSAPAGQWRSPASRPRPALAARGRRC